ncbi:MAG: GBS Bsp-like repeat-containing protein [Ruminococcus sp.]|nr:GBS Bsp-like repeat-containing protein [Ruminococcus sp.]
MIGKIKKAVSVLLSISMCMTLFMYIPPVKSHVEVMTSQAAGMTIDQIRQKFPVGKYWNHAGKPGSSNSVNNQDGYTSTPCPKHGTISTSSQTCNGFCPSGTQLSWQCMGFAEKIGYDITGYNPRNNANGWTTSTNSNALNTLKAGDIVRYKNNGHSIYVLGVNGDTVTYADCNSDGHCIIRWDQTISKSTLRSSFTHVRSAPFAISGGSPSQGTFPGEEDGSYSVPISVTASKRINTYDGNGNIESNRYIDSGDNCTIDKVYKNGFVYIGYPTSSGTRWAYAKKDDFDLQPSSRSPEGIVDAVSGGAGTVYVRGWGFDRDKMGDSIDVHVYLKDGAGNMIGVGAIRADKLREDVNNVYGYGSYHGFEDTLQTDSVGNFHVMIALIDTGSDNATWIDGGEVTITPGDSTNPIVSNVKYSRITPTGFTVQCNATDNQRIKEVKVAIWIHDVTEPIWHDMVAIGNDTYSFDFDISTYDNKNGPYNCHIYAWDDNGNQAFGATEPIIISCDLGDNFDAFIINPESNKFVTASAVNDNVILHDSSEGAYATKIVWNFSKNPDNSYRITSYYNSKCLDVEKGNDADGTNICTYEANNDANQKWYVVKNGDSYRLMPAFSSTRSLDIAGGTNANGSNIQLWDSNDSSAQRFNIIPITDTTAPVLSDVIISDITKDGYKVTIKTSDNTGIKKVAVPTWSDYNWQDDLFNDWTNTALATQISNDTWVYNVRLSEHNNERGVYYTDVYVWDFNGNETAHRGENKLRHTVEVGMYSLTADPNGGTMKDADWKNDTTDSVTYSTKLIYNGPNWCSVTSCIPKRAGYKFTGFYTSPTGGTKIYGADGKCLNEGKYFKDGLYQQTADLKIYAQWEAEVVSGDINADGNLNTADLILIQKWLLGVPDAKLDNWENADLCKDGVIDVFDLIEMRKLLTEFK